MIRNGQIGTKVKEVEIQPLKIPSTRDPITTPVPQKEPVKV